MKIVRTKYYADTSSAIKSGQWKFCYTMNNLTTRQKRGGLLMELAISDEKLGGKVLADMIIKHVIHVGVNIILQNTPRQYFRITIPVLTYFSNVDDDYTKVGR